MAVLGEEAAATSKGSVVVVQTEDETAALLMAIGGGLAGVRASTSTSGPGFCLMAEGMGWAGMNEVPVVVTLYQRGGPSTGLPTRHAQGDLRFALHVGHDEFPRIILASGDIEESFYDVTKAFNFAERYQVPVIHLLDKAMANADQTCPMFDLNEMKIDRGALIRGSVRESDGQGLQEVRVHRDGDLPQACHRRQGRNLLELGRRARREGPHQRGPDQQDDDDGEEDGEARAWRPRRYLLRTRYDSTAPRTPR